MPLKSTISEKPGSKSGCERIEDAWFTNSASLVSPVKVETTNLWLTSIVSRTPILASLARTRVGHGFRDAGFITKALGFTGCAHRRYCRWLPVRRGDHQNDGGKDN